LPDPTRRPRARRSPAWPGRTSRLVLLALLAALGCLLQAVPAAATVEVRINGVEPEIEANIRASLGLVRHGQREDLSEAGVRRLYARARSQVREAMRPYGYYRPRIRPRLEPDGQNWRAVFDIEPGAPVLVTEIDVRIEGEGHSQPELLEVVGASPLVSGRRLRHTEYDRLRSRLQARAKNLGYFEAAFTARRLEVDPEALSAKVVLHLETGPRYRVGSVEVPQEIIDEALLARIVTLRAGDPYDANEASLMQYRLTDTLYFSSALVETGEPDPQTRTVPVRIVTVPTPSRRIRLGVGYATDTRLRGTIDVNWRHINQAGHSARTSISLSRELSELSARYRIPVGDPLRESLLLRAAVRRQDFADLDSTRSEIGASLVTMAGEHWQRALFVDLVDERTRVPGEPEFQDISVVPGVAFERLSADDILFPRDGYRLRGEVRGSEQTLGAGSKFLRFEFDANRVLSYGEDWRFFLRSKLGLGLTEEFDTLPASQRFYAGGDQSVRGYGYNSLGPQDEAGNVIGGKHLVFASIEAERRVWRRVALAAFVDTGNALEQLDDGLETSVGLGVNVHTPIGTLRVSVARSITESRGMRVHISIRPDL
jgi:translocation and assembly module TamA